MPVFRSTNAPVPLDADVYLAPYADALKKRSTTGPSLVRHRFPEWLDPH